VFTLIVDQPCNIAFRSSWHWRTDAHQGTSAHDLKEPGAYVFFKPNDSPLTSRKGAEPNQTGHGESRISLDAANAKTFLCDRGRDNVCAFRGMQVRERLARPRFSLWLARLEEALQQLTEFVRVAHDIGVGEVHPQRLVFLESDAIGLAMVAVSQRRRIHRVAGDQECHLKSLRARCRSPQ
jgi:hypothetical protein